MVDTGDIPDSLRVCPYCKKEIQTRPYWSHVAKEHPEEYENSKTTWYPLFKDYILAGMDINTILTVMPELFNATREEIESFLIRESFKEKVSDGTVDTDAKKEIGKQFDKSIDEVDSLLQ
ncbi:hypothetical protein GF325_09280 [Candidatus Bathyarchaeota archaeon]|nr:hypothetical protein [Candidatus Bathyarchaeota archaeon]